MINSSDIEQDENLIGHSPDVFIEYYNSNIPDSFPRATKKTLKAFKTQYPSLFGDDGHWVVNKHRKKYMDWLATHHNSD